MNMHRDPSLCGVSLAGCLSEMERDGERGRETGREGERERERERRVLVAPPATRVIPYQMRTRAFVAGGKSATGLTNVHVRLVYKRCHRGIGFVPLGCRERPEK